MRRFNNFIEKNELVDIPMMGRKFTLYKPKGLINSRIDCILVSREWLDKWPNSKHLILDISVSDHCALVLKTDNTNWGPKPFRSLDIWQKDGRFMESVSVKWGSYKVQGSEIFIFKEKLKLLKADLKIRIREVFGNIDQMGEDLQKKIQKLDAKDDEDDLDEEGWEDRKWLLAEQRKNNHRQEALL